jgi:cell division protein FtsQ
MWDDARALRQLANTLFGVSAAVLLFGALHFIAHLPLFPLQAVELEAVPVRVDRVQIEDVAHNAVRGNFFTVDLNGVRRAFEQLPWVRKVSVRIEFPWKLRVALEEHVALARWNDVELVNTYGEVFAADSTDALPKFSGGPGTAAEVTEMYRAAGAQLAPLGQKVTQISLSPRRAWELRTANGMVLELGREQMQQRLARFVAVYPYSLARLGATGYMDLRYQNGFAAHIPGGVVKGNNGSQHSKA